MPYIPHTDQDLLKMLRELGPDYLEKLRGLIPDDLRTSAPLDIADGLSEQELKGLLKDISEENTSVADFSSFLGAGAYNHYVPSIVGHLTGRSEFYTSYTPYQPELSQGTLQAVFEYQTLICQLTGMDVSNASLYDGASATAEAVLMARRIAKKKTVYLSTALHPEYRETVKTYLAASAEDIIELPINEETGETDHTLLTEANSDETACLVIQSPNFFGVIEDTSAFSDIIHAKKGLSINVTIEPLSLGILQPPGETGADIAVGEAQGFGTPLSFGGPYLGFMGVKKEHLRQMPGRVIGETVDAGGNRCYCLTLATREQHIRREKATSNICTNEGLSALAAAIYLTSVGREGLRNLAVLNLSKAQYLIAEMEKIPFISRAFVSHTFNEISFTFRKKFLGKKDFGEILTKLLEKKIIGGLELKRFYPELSSHLLVCVTEMNTKEDIDEFTKELREL
ncbi:MAG: aminomethyl-transferring glycine dehydrogenase subunit GcvPA [Thermodesulfobacteriota bacterium]